MKKTTITIEGVPFTYDDEIEDITYETIGPIREDDARDLLSTTKKLFDVCGMKFYLIYGSLLGAVRDHGLIDGDEDVDVYVDSEELLRKSLPYLFENGLKVCRIYEHRLYSFRTNNDGYIDVYIKNKLPVSIWRIWCVRIAGAVFPKCYIRRFDKIDFLGVECLCPHKPERVLRYMYGKTWRIPIKSHDFIIDSPSRYWWRTKMKPCMMRFVSSIKKALKKPIKKLWKKVR